MTADIVNSQALSRASICRAGPSATSLRHELPLYVAASTLQRRARSNGPLTSERSIRRSRDVTVLRGATWTTVCTLAGKHTVAIEACCAHRGLLAVEMEAAALYAFAAARSRPVICFAHVTNRMGQIEGDFEKGDANGAAEAIAVAAHAARRIGLWIAD